MTKEFPGPRATRFDPLGAAWRFLAVPQTLMVLMGCLAVVLVAGALVPQNLPEIEGNPQAWLSPQSGSWDQQNGLMRALGLYDVYHAPWFHLLLALLGLVLFVRLVNASDLAWQATIRKSWALESFAFWGRHRPSLSISSMQPLDAIQPTIRNFFVQRGYRWTDLSGLESANAVAIRRVLSLWAQPLLYGGLLVALIGLFVAGTWGWQHQDWRPAPGESWNVGHGLPYAIRLDAVRLPATGEGGQGFASEIVWQNGATSFRKDVVMAGRPARFQGVTVRQLGTVPVVKLRAWDQTERALELQPAGAESGVLGEVEIVFPTDDAQPLILIPSQDRFLALDLDAACGNDLPSFQVAILRDGGDILPLGALTESGTLSGDGLRITADLSYRPILRVDYRPAMGLVLAGMILAVLAFAVSWVVPSRLLWIASQADGKGKTLVQILVPAAGWGRRWLLQTAERLREDLSSGDE